MKSKTLITHDRLVDNYFISDGTVEYDYEKYFDSVRKDNPEKTIFGIASWSDGTYEVYIQTRASVYYDKSVSLIKKVETMEQIERLWRAITE